MRRIFVTLALILTTFSFSYGQRFAYVDTEYILSKIPAYQEAQNSLDAVADEWRKEIEKRLQEIDKMYRTFQAEQVLLTDQMKQQRINEIEKKERDVKEYQKAKFGPDGELFKKRQELIKPIQDDIYEQIQKLATSKGYDFIFDKSSGVSMLFASDRYDKSDDIIDALGY
ncbi:MAG: OmpH family outer membrane protein [Chitinophagales bacterium]|nr:OmpH family outer membrane protein [Chitinophagales bacterium]